MSVQHEYRGQGDPNGMVEAAINSHYLDENDESTWLCVRSAGEDSVWVKLRTSAPIKFEGGEVYTISSARDMDGVVGVGVTFRFTLAEAVYSNIALAGEPLEFVTSSETHVQIRPVSTGGVLLTVTPLTQY